MRLISLTSGMVMLLIVLVVMANLQGNYHVSAQSASPTTSPVSTATEELRDAGEMLGFGIVSNEVTADAPMFPNGYSQVQEPDKNVYLPVISSSRTCSAEKIAEVIEPASDAAPEVKINCNLNLDRNHVVTKKLVLEGAESTGVTIKCNFAETRVIEIKSRRYVDNITNVLKFENPENITIQDCNITGAVSIFGMTTDDVIASSKLSGHVLRVRNNAPKNIILDNLTIIGVGRIPLYIFPGVTNVQLINSEISGYSNSVAIYLDAESYGNTIKNNFIHINTITRELVAVDGSSYNIIAGNRFSELDKGGIYLYRNCGERGAIRHSTPSYNEIVENYFYYDLYTGGYPAVYLGSRDGASSFCNDDLRDDGTPYPYGSSISDLDHAQFNTIMNNKIRKRSVADMIKVNNPSINSPNYIHDNVTVNE